MSRVALFEQTLRTLEWNLGGQANGAMSEQLKLQQAKGKMASTASLLQLCDGASKQDIRMLTVHFSLTLIHSQT